MTAAHYRDSVVASISGYYKPVPSASVYVYAPGTTTQVTCYSDSATTIPLTQPLTADGKGVLDFYLPAERSVDFLVSGTGIVSSTISNVVVSSPDTLWTGGLTIQGGGETITAGGLNITAGGITVSAGGLTITAGGLTITSGNVLFTDNTQDIGTATGSRPRNVYTNGVLQIYDPNAGLANDGVNYEDVQLGWVGTAPGLRYQSGGTGNAGRTLRITGGGSVSIGDTNTDRFSFSASGFTCATDNTYDIGASGANRPRNIYQSGGTLQSYNPGSGIANDGTNYERMEQVWSANVMYLQTNASGTGVRRPIVINGNPVYIRANNLGAAWLFNGAGNLLAETDNAFDIGASGANRPRNIYQAGGTFQSYNPGAGIANDGTNYELFELLWAGNFRIQTRQGGTGVARSIQILTQGAQEVQFGTSGAINWRLGTAGHLYAATDNTYDIGASGATRPRTVYAGTNVNANVSVIAGSNVQITSAFATNLGLRLNGAGWLYAGSGVPANGSGNDGDFYFRTDGGAGTSIYQRRTGAWVATGA